MMDSSKTHLSGDLEELGERRLALLTPLAARPRCSRIDARAAASALGISERQVSTLVRRLRAAGGGPAALQAQGSNSGNGRPRPSRATEHLLHETVVKAEPHSGTTQIVALIQD